MLLSSALDGTRITPLPLHVYRVLLVSVGMYVSTSSVRSSLTTSPPKRNFFPSDRFYLLHLLTLHRPTSLLKKVLTVDPPLKHFLGKVPLFCVLMSALLVQVTRKLKCLLLSMLERSLRKLLYVERLFRTVVKLLILLRATERTMCTRLVNRLTLVRQFSLAS